MVHSENQENHDGRSKCAVYGSRADHRETPSSNIIRYLQYRIQTWSPPRGLSEPKFSQKHGATTDTSIVDSNVEVHRWPLWVLNLKRGVDLAAIDWVYWFHNRAVFVFAAISQ